MIKIGPFWNPVFIPKSVIFPKNEDERAEQLEWLEMLASGSVKLTNRQLKKVLKLVKAQ